MPYQITSRRSSRKARKVINIHQNKWAKGYVSTIEDSRRPLDSLSDMTNMEMVQDNVVRPRPPLVVYGTQPTLTIIGRGKIRKSSERYNLFMMDDSGTGKLYRQKDGGAYTLIGGTYSSTAWASCVQSKGRAYIWNGVDNLTYVTVATDAIVTYTALTTPVMTSVTRTGMAGTNITHYYRVTASNAVGESIASIEMSQTSGKIRDNWIDGTDYMTLVWGAVAGAVSYTIYYGSRSGTTEELYSIGATTTTWEDRGTIAANVFKIAPEGNSTAGVPFTWMYQDSKNSQIFGIATDNKLYYSAPGTGDFSPFNGGGWVEIDGDGDTVLNYVDGFRNGKGDPLITVSARGAAGKGKLFHVTFESLTIGDQVIIYPNVYEANGQAGTYAPRATIKERDSLHYPTGVDFKSTGTSQNIVGILTTGNISQAINDNDVPNISLQYLDKAVGVAHNDKLYFALPVGSTENNQIWVLDLSRKNAWTLRWTVAAKDLWLYEDNSGSTHFCALVNNKILEFTRASSITHEDDGVAWTSRVAFESLVWDEDGIILGKIRNMYMKLLYPRGTITANTTGLTRSGATQSTGSDSFTVTTTPTGWDDWQYDVMQYDADPGVVNTYGKSIAILQIKPKGLLAELSWEVSADTSGTDYILSAVNTRGHALDQLILKA